MLSQRTCQLALTQMRRDGGRHPKRDPVLQIEQIGQLTIEATVQL